ncbi:hypothetical protein INT47_006858 [Mucor saturninus]|uniref:Uncharacterized protein n=1 Tax=Mucor saturninus TaxID=64648 RepID=A0A8H7V8J5_9FUNG|nr:hypothetical protein INT47_006858 [Mucor saturninus]
MDFLGRKLSSLPEFLAGRKIPGIFYLGPPTVTDSDVTTTSAAHNLDPSTHAQIQKVNRDEIDGIFSPVPTPGFANEDLHYDLIASRLAVSARRFRQNIYPLDVKKLSNSLTDSDKDHLNYLINAFKPNNLAEELDMLSARLIKDTDLGDSTKGSKNEKGQIVLKQLRLNITTEKLKAIEEDDDNEHGLDPKGYVFAIKKIAKIYVAVYLKPLSMPDYLFQLPDFVDTLDTLYSWSHHQVNLEEIVIPAAITHEGNDVFFRA